MSSALHRLSVAITGSNIGPDAPPADAGIESPALSELLARPDPSSPYYYHGESLASFSFQGSQASSRGGSAVSPPAGGNDICPLERSTSDDVPTSRRDSDLLIAERRRSSAKIEQWDRDAAALVSPVAELREFSAVTPVAPPMRKKASHVSFSDDHIRTQRPSLASVNFSRPSRSSSSSSLSQEIFKADHRRNSSFVRGFGTLPLAGDGDDEIHPLDEEEQERRRESEQRRQNRQARHASFQRGFTALPYDGEPMPRGSEDASRSKSPEELELKDNADRFAVMTAHLYTRSKNLEFFKSESLTGIGIVSIRIKKNDYRTYCDVHAVPVDEREELNEHLEDWDQGISSLNPEVAIKLTSNVVLAILSRLDPDALDIPIDAETRIQVVEKMAHLGTARKHQFAAFVRQEGCLVVWSDDISTVIEAAEALEARFVQYVWLSSAHKDVKRPSSLRPTLKSENTMVDSVFETPGVEKLGYFDGADLEKGDPAEHKWYLERPMRLYAPILTGTALAGNIAFVGLACKTLISEYMLDGKPMRFLLLLTSPFTFCVAFFFCLALISCCWTLLGPVNQFHENSAFYSGKAPERRVKRRLPHMTVVMPVYKEGLEGVIVPTIDSLKEAIMTYERQGGTASILVCEDGMQIWDEETANIRKAYYDSRAIGWVARPKHGHKGFIRKGRFKKASNMNFAFAVSLRIEEIMDEMRPTPKDSEKAIEEWSWTAEDEDELYAEAMQLAIGESCGTAWAAGNIRIGEYILIIDSDTRVPTDCFLDAVNELDDSPQVAIIQHESDVMMVSTSYFEAGIAHFTRHINKAISFCCANGEVAPFVGHNAFMRWSAIQDSCFVDPEDGWTKMWSESHVSEDFDMSLRAQMKGYTTRWVTYSNGGFKEGVSLTCDNELDRWQKYAFGCSELIFYPLKDWWRHGILTPLFKTFAKSSIPIHSKLSVLAYLTSYWAIAVAALTCTLNWILIGIYEAILDDFYLESFKVFLTCVVVFSLFGNLTSAVFKYRLRVEGFGSALGDNLMWVPFFFIFFSGLSWHVAAALVAHMVGYDMQWGSTLKEVEISNFFREIPLILKRFWPAYIFAWTLVIGMIVMSLPFLPDAIRVTSMTAILPSAIMAGCHILYPILLNPYLMLFSF